MIENNYVIIMVLYLSFNDYAPPEVIYDIKC